MSRSFGVPGSPLTEKNGESHCSASVKPVPAGNEMRCMAVPPKLWAVPPRKGSPAKAPGAKTCPGTKACSYACRAWLPAEEKYATPLAFTLSTACAMTPSWYMGAST